MPDIKDAARRDPNFTQRLVTAFSITKVPLSAATHMGLSAHLDMLSCTGREYISVAVKPDFEQGGVPT